MKINVNENNKIKNIIFDLGGVLLNIDYDLTAEAFINEGIENFEVLYSQARQTPLFDKFEKGLINAEAFRAGLRQYLNLDDYSIDKAWNAMLLDFPKERIALLEKLNSHYRLFLLSNTNEIHIKWYSEYLKKQFGFSNLSHIFEKEYYSYNTGFRKPEKEIFQLVLNENKLLSDETLFIDDSIQHIESARSLGLQYVFLKKPLTVIDLFEFKR